MIKFQIFNERQDMIDPKYEIFRYRDETVREVELHLHDHYEILFLTKGHIEYLIGGFTHTLEAGEMLLIPPGTYHCPVPGSNSQYERVVLWADRKYLEEVSGEDKLNACFENTALHYNLKNSSGERITRLVFLLQEEYYGNAFGHELYAGGVFLQLMIEINRMVLNRDKSNNAPIAAAPIKLIVDVLTYIDGHYAEKITLENLADRFFVSKYHLSRVFTQSTGTSLYRYIIQKRLFIAKQMLENGTPPGEVCFLCGFKDYTNFYKAFKAEYGVNPKVFHENRGD